jgi:hypothetical protein
MLLAPIHNYIQSNERPIGMSFGEYIDMTFAQSGGRRSKCSGEEFGCQFVR